ncbi:MAG: hypothetical protein QM478_08100 [Flavobacteriaceae bacterium]
MDELDKLKGAWKSQDYSNHKVSSTDIYKMLQAKSSSYVKWIFYISIIEFLLVIVLNLTFDNDKYLDIYDEMGMHNLIIVGSIISYGIMLVFMYLFYKNYKLICVDCDARTLMKSILKTRKTVKFYIYFNIGFMALTSFILFYHIFSSDKNVSLYKVMSNVPEDFSTKYLLISVTVVMILFMGLLLLIYRIIYGILLRRLKKNYKELEQLDK